MKFSLAIGVFCVLFVALQAMSIKVHGVVKNHQFIDRESTYAAADPNGYAQKAFTFPPVCFLSWQYSAFQYIFFNLLFDDFFQKGPSYSSYEITGFKQIDEGTSPKVEITSGGIGSRHVSMIVTSEYGKPLASTFHFYGKKLLK